jgi:mono/diheme cytochrome c family protein
MQLLFLIRLLFLGSGLCLFVGLGMGARGAMPRPGQSDPDVTPAAAARDKQMAFAARYFRHHCATCHGEHFTGADARDLTPQIPDFTSGAWQKSRSDAQLLVSILEGKGKRMPPFHGRLDREKARALVAYVRQAAAAGAGGRPGRFRAALRRVAAAAGRVPRAIPAPGGCCREAGSPLRGQRAGDREEVLAGRCMA